VPVDVKIWLIQIGEPLPCDTVGRLLRTGLMANTLASLGHDVVWWASTFDHVRKKQRFNCSTSLSLAPNYELRLLKGMGYRSNISLRRLADHAQVAWALRQEMRHRPRPDVLVSSYPTLETSWVAESFAMEHDIPLVLDIRDLWPDVFAEMGSPAVRALTRRAILPYRWFARAVVRRATTLTGLSRPFLEWASRMGGRRLGHLDRVFHMGYSSNCPTTEELRAAEQFWESLGVRRVDNELLLCFFGTLGHQFDLETIIEGARRLEQQGVPCRFVICGSGEKEKSLRSRARNLRSVLFPGWIGTHQIWALMRKSHLGLAPYRASENFAMNLPNKLAEYLSAGLPIITSAGGYLAQKLNEHGCGIGYRPGDVDRFVSIVRELSDDRANLVSLAKNAIALYESQFVAEKVYGDYAEYLAKVASARQIDEAS
jgi:glycosyltransferase involved in cell wall biosynthesis